MGENQRGRKIAARLTHPRQQLWTKRCRTVILAIQQNKNAAGATQFASRQFNMALQFAWLEEFGGGLTDYGTNHNSSVPASQFGVASQ